MSAPGLGADRRTALWDSMLDAEMNHYFWELISARYARWDRNLKLLIAIAASGTVAAWSDPVGTPFHGRNPLPAQGDS